MASVITRYVNNAADAGGDGTTDALTGGTCAYDTLNNAITDIQTDYANFVTSDVQVDLLVDGTGSLPINPTITINSTMDATRYLHIKPKTDSQWNQTGILDKVNYPYINFDSGALIVSGTGARISKIQFVRTTALGEFNLFFRFTVSSCVIDSCMFVPEGADHADSRVIESTADPGTTTFKNCLFYDANGEVFEGTKAGTPFKLVNCTVVDNNKAFHLPYVGQDAILLNCLFDGNTTFWTGSSDLDATSDYNSGDFAAPTNWGSNSLASQTHTFNASGSNDFRLAGADSNQIAGGVGTTNSDVTSEDIVGSPRASATASIGAFQRNGKVWVNDAATWDSGAVEQTYPGLANWSDTSIDMQNVIDTTGLTGQLYVIVETATGAIASRAITVGGMTDINLHGTGRGVMRGIGRGIG